MEGIGIVGEVCEGKKGEGGEGEDGALEQGG